MSKYINYKGHRYKRVDADLDYFGHRDLESKIQKAVDDNRWELQKITQTLRDFNSKYDHTKEVIYKDADVKKLIAQVKKEFLSVSKKIQTFANTLK